MFYEIRAQNFTPKMGRFGFSQLIKNYAKKYPVDHRHNYFKVSSLRSSTNFKKGIFSKTVYKLIYFCLMGKKRRFYYKKYQLFI